MMPGSSEWLIILGVALLIFGPSRLPGLGKALGEGIRNFKGGLNGLKDSAKEAGSDVSESGRISGRPAGERN